MHRFCAVYMWESRFEKMRRPNLFLSPYKGGLGLVNLEIKLKVQRFLLFRDNKNLVLERALLQLGGRYLEEWQARTGEPANRAPILRYYKEIELAVRYFEQRFSWEYLMKVNRKHLYWNTIDSITPPPLYRSAFENSLCSNVFKRLRKYPVRTSTKDFFVKFHCEVLSVKTWLVNKGFFVPWNTNCALCPTPETLQHTFLFCTNAELFWAELRAVFKINLYPNWHSMKFLDVGECDQKECSEILLLIGLYAIWRSRTDHTLVLEKGKSAWRHFFDGFVYTSTLIAESKLDVSEEWDRLKSLLKVYVRNPYLSNHSE